MIIHASKPLAIDSWDWKDQPDWDAINEVVKDFQDKFSAGIRIVPIVTGADDYAIVIGTAELTDEDAKTAYNQRYEIEEGVDHESLDWAKAEAYLKEIRQMYTDIGTAGLFGLNGVINPLLIRFENGERTKELHDEIMDLK